MVLKSVVRRGGIAFLELIRTYFIRYVEFGVCMEIVAGRCWALDVTYISIHLKTRDLSI